MTDASRSQQAPAPIVVSLIAGLRERGVRYCHWKSTRTLADALAGRTDLDLLVDVAHRSRFERVVTGLGFRRFVSHPSRRLPGVEDWIGLEPTGPRLVHLHVYHELVLGEELVKNHRLPVERVLLEETEQRQGIPVPRPELELAILAVRALLKYREDAVLRDLLPVGSRGGLPQGIADEIAELLTRTSPSAVRSAIDAHLPMLPADTILAFLAAATQRPVDALRVRGLRHDLEAALSGFRRRPTLALIPARASAFVDRSRVVRAGRRLAERLRGRPSGRRKRPAGVGRTVAVVGVDGAGKSTVIESLADTFSWRLNVATLYLGSSRPGPVSATAQYATRIVRSTVGPAGRLLGERSPVTRLCRAALSLVLGVRAVAEASERARRARLARRLAADGWLVLLDRYPMPQLTVRDRQMDAARLRPDPASGWLLRRLAERERRIYRGLPRPDLILALSVPAAVARARKPSAPASLEAKANAIAALGAGDPDVVVVDASQPLESVVRCATELVWSRLSP